MPPVLGIVTLTTAVVIVYKATGPVVNKASEALEPVHHYFKYKQ